MVENYIPLFAFCSIFVCVILILIYCMLDRICKILKKGNNP